MSEILNFKVTSKLEINDFMQIISVLQKKQRLLLKTVFIIGMLIILTGVIIFSYDCLRGDFSNLSFIIFCFILIIIFSLVYINLNKIQTKIQTKIFFRNKKETSKIYNFCFYDTYYTVEYNKMGVSANITIKYDDVNCFVANKDLIIFKDKTKAKSLACIKQNSEFQIGTLEEFLHFFKNKINI